MDKLISRQFLKNIIAEELLKRNIRNNWQHLTEASLHRVLTKYYNLGFIIISAERSCEAEQGRKCTEEEANAQTDANRNNEQQIKKDIRRAGFGFVPSYGGFREEVVDPETGETRLVDNPKPEASFIVPARGAQKGAEDDHEQLKELGITLAQKYNQDSFLYKPPNNVDRRAYYITQGGEIDMTFDDVVANDLAQIYFTRLRKSSTDRRFSLTENFVLYIPEPPVDDAEARRRYGEIFIRVKNE